MAKVSKIIDVDSHPVLSFGERAPVGEGHKQPDWSIESTLSYMEEYGISACVLSSPAAANDATGQQARDIARRTNEVLAKIVSRHPARFGAVATLPGLDADGALVEIGYALDTLKLDGVTTTTSLNDVYLGEPQFDPWLEELNRRSATLFVHPTITRAGDLMAAAQTYAKPLSYSLHLPAVTNGNFAVDTKNQAPRNAIRLLDRHKLICVLP